MKKVLMAAAAFAAIFTIACNKSDNNTNSASIVGKWNLNTLRDKITVGNTVKKDSTVDVSLKGAYIDFRTDGKVYSYFDSYDTSFYTQAGNTLYISNLRSTQKDTVTIASVTNTNLSLYQKSTYTAALYESWMNFSK